jgi:Ser/Thr protein kinase RdoA (MazF antagonist)
MTLPGTKASAQALQKLLAARYPGATLAGGKAVARALWPVALGGRAHLLKLHDPWVHGRLAALNAIHRAALDNSLTPPQAEDVDGCLLGLHQGLAYSLHVRLELESAGLPAPEGLASALAALHNALRGCCPGPALENHFRRDTVLLAARAAQAGFPGALRALEPLGPVLQGRSCQPVHGDMHPGNVLVSGGRVYFVDFDSAAALPVQAEAAFAAETFYGLDSLEAGLFLAAFSAVSGVGITPDEACRWLVFHAVQRVCFILECAEQGDDRWLADYESQRARIAKGLTWLEERER